MEATLSNRKNIHRERSFTTAASREKTVTNIPEKLIFYGLLTTILLSAVPYGTVDPFSKLLLILPVCLFAGIRVVKGLIERSFRFSEPIIFLPLALILLLAIIQMLPLPFLDGKTISLDPYETKIFIVSFAVLIIFGELLYSYTNSKQRLKSLIALVLITGAASASFGILRDLGLLDSTGLITTYFSAETQGYAQFINRNHFTALMEMSLGLTFGLLLKGQLADKFKFVGWILSGLFIYAAIAANSRGGIISVAGLSLFGVVIHVMTRKIKKSHRKNEEKTSRVVGFWQKAFIATVLSVLIFGMSVLTVVFVGGDAVVSRFEKLESQLQIADEERLNRLAIWTATLQMIKERPLLGVGFGGYETAMPRFDNSTGVVAVRQAHNDYLEILANGGITAFILFAIFGVIVVRRALSNFKSRDTLTRASCFGALIGIFGVMIHNFVDFGLHIMINALIFTVLIVIATIRLPNLEFFRGQLGFDSSCILTRQF